MEPNLEDANNILFILLFAPKKCDLCNLDSSIENKNPIH